MNELVFLCLFALFRFVVFAGLLVLMYAAPHAAPWIFKQLCLAHQFLTIRGNLLALLKLALMATWSIAAFLLIFSVLIGFNHVYEGHGTAYCALVIMHLLLCWYLYELNSILYLQLQVAETFHRIAHHDGKFSTIIHISLHLLYYALVHGKGDVLIGAISAYVLYLATVLLIAEKEDAKHIFEEMIIALVSECVILKLFHDHAPVAHFLSLGAFITLPALCMAVPEGQLVDFRRFHVAADLFG